MLCLSRSLGTAEDAVAESSVDVVEDYADCSSS